MDESCPESGDLAIMLEFMIGATQVAAHEIALFAAFGFLVLGVSDLALFIPLRSGSALWRSAD